MLVWCYVMCVYCVQKVSLTELYGLDDFKTVTEDCGIIQLLLEYKITTRFFRMWFYM